MILAAALEFGMRQPQHLIIFFGALLTAGMTAFYMFRMVIMTFFGKPRTTTSTTTPTSRPPTCGCRGDPGDPSFSFWFKSPSRKGWLQELVQKPASVANVREGFARPAAEHDPAPMMEHKAAPAAHNGDAATMPTSRTRRTCTRCTPRGRRHPGIVLAFGVYLFGWVEPAASRTG